MFYYDNNLLFVKCTTGVLKETTYPKVGYTGTTELPKLPASAVGSYTGNESSGAAVVFNLKQDLTGTYKGMPFVAVYDGANRVSFTIASVRYLFDVTTNVITYDTESVTLTRTGEVTEVIPTALCGTWKGAWEGYGTGSDGSERSFVITSTGEFCYQSTVSGTLTIKSQTASTIVLTVEAKDSTTTYNFTITYNVDTNSMSAKVTYVFENESRMLECSSLSKVTE